MTHNFAKKSLALHKKLKGKIKTCTKVDVKDSESLSLVYTPGVGAVSSYIAKHKSEVGEYTFKNNSVAVISDGSAVLGLGNLGPEGAYPVMEGKCLLFKNFAGIDAIPILLSTQNPQEIISAILAIAPTFGGINLEDIAAPKCFGIEKTLRERLSIPVIHDDQWGAAVVTLAALLNALKIVGKKIETAKITISGVGAAGSAIIKILHASGARNILACDSKGIISTSRKLDHGYKKEIARITNSKNQVGLLSDAIKNSDVFIGVSSPNIVNSEMVFSMSEDSIVFALANPVPEIAPEEARRGDAFIIATGRSDYPNQVNNSLAFPGVFRGALDRNIKQITIKMLIKAASNLSTLVKNPNPKKIIPSIFDAGVVKAVASAIS
ncbi:malate dehydrogenase [Candidatus Roizmanbacteria bacterium RIFCSPHIGHO2_01_FULL_39_8]|uniref:Malate dehydrogenase n=3 Tax=Candidatus Roizmaniibacteriota TaxID=1752723 RepID=A0A1F7GHN1_9BACT|nr:MAG: malate dehydrogenase [Candidatus Roizmanbacteria bacterium RIFCSPHIGHO2_01_FULL_39_8]OGK25725.1 MAG: malate dehydrogenase [Candidatus Roizmanbacteria bacterium RIFCSPHIGHO2_02_FULL_39_9]OGK37236.1 MAG: malate dehydrogenase [Candidatus Roizmanbacteria bacterium RIFCSPHIGHO2_12_FULL_39_8]